MLEMEEKGRIIAEVMDGFDFKTVEKVMKALNWCWEIDGKVEVPSISVMKWRAEGLLDGVMLFFGDKVLHSLSCGGFKATLTETGMLTLEFVVEEQEAV